MFSIDVGVNGRIVTAYTAVVSVCMIDQRGTTLLGWHVPRIFGWILLSIESIEEGGELEEVVLSLMIRERRVISGVAQSLEERKAIGNKELLIDFLVMIRLI